jgi:hypothetical protein
MHLTQWTAPAPGIEVPESDRRRRTTNQQAVPMQVSTIGLDLAKIVFQVHGIDANENGARSRPDAYLFVLRLQTLREGTDAPERRGPEPCIL